MIEAPKQPPIFRLPAELHLHIISFLTIEKLRRCRHICRTGFYCTKSWHEICCGERIVDDERGIRTITHPAILLLRATHPYFRALISLSQDLLLQIERHPSAPRSLLGVFRACCVCLRLRPMNEFALSALPAFQPARRSYEDQCMDQQAEKRFCRDCGFHAYPQPHPALSPRRQQRRRGDVLVQQTTYAPGTKVVFLRAAPFLVGYDVWVWCLDCRLLKTSVGSGEAGCRFFCKDCCTRLGCRVTGHTRDGCRLLYTLHTGYAEIEGEIDEEKLRREHRLGVGAVYIAQGKSLLLKNVEQPVGDQEDEECGRLSNVECKAWFDFEGHPTTLPSPSSEFDYLPRGPRRELLESRLPSGTTAICCFIGGRRPRNPLRPYPLP